MLCALRPAFADSVFGQGRTRGLSTQPTFHSFGLLRRNVLLFAVAKLLLGVVLYSFNKIECQLFTQAAVKIKFGGK